MLYLNPPYFVINGISVLPDDKDPLQFYVSPMMPHLTSLGGPGGASLPQLQLIEFRGGAGTGGFLNFDVNLGISSDDLSEIQQQVQRQMNLSSPVRLSPITFVDGSVRLVLLGAESGDTAPAGGPGSTAPATQPVTGAPSTDAPRFVVKIQNAAKPALFGDNQATFSVQFGQDGVTVMDAALKRQMMPVAVIYSLQFLGLRPAFNVRISADWNRVQTYLDQHYGGNFLFFSSDIEKSVDKLIEDRVITIDESTFTTQEDLGTAAASDRDRAVAGCYELVKTNFFESSLPPPDPNKPDDWDKAVQTFRNISDIAAAGGVGGMAGFSYKKVDLTRIDQKSLNFDVTERTTVLRTIYPQGHLAGLLNTIAQAGVSLDQFIVPVDLDNPFFQRRQVTVTTHADFETDSIASIDVQMTYNNIGKTVTLTGAAPQASVDWTSLLVNAQMSLPVAYTYTVNFKNVDTAQRPGTLTSSTLSAVGNIDIEPRGQLYDITVVPVRAFGLPWDRYPSVEVECHYLDAANGINEQPSAILNSANTEVDWSLFLCDTVARSFKYRLAYTLASGGTTRTDWITTSDAAINISDPFPSKVGLTVLAALDWSVFSQALVFLAYPRKEQAAVQQTFTLTEVAPTSPAFIAEKQQASQNFIYYEARLIKRNGQVWTIPGSVTSDAFLILQDGMKGHQLVVVKSEAIDFASKKVMQINVQLRYLDPANGISFAQSVQLDSMADSGTFAYDYLDAHISPEYRADIQLSNGQTKSVDWTPATSNQVVVPLSQLD
ncbi:MAG: hypothetical protein JO057_03105 [Chloroflexi bacterium]|nr:hypothetical protein [Chloroflexota bacterium]